MGTCCGGSSELPDRKYDIKEPLVVKKHHIDIDTDYEVPRIFTVKQLKWSNESERCIDKENGYVLKCNHLHSDCIHIQRLFFVLLALQKNKDLNSNDDISTFSAKKLINNDFKDYSDVHLINDYIHLLQKHLNANHKSISELFDTKFIHCNAPDENECIQTRRLFSQQTTNYDNSDNSEIAEVLSLHFIAMIHSNLFHYKNIENILKVKSNDKFKTNANSGINTKNTKSSSSSGNNYNFGEAMNYYQFAPRFDYEEESKSNSTYSSYSGLSSYSSSSSKYSMGYEYALRCKKIVLVSKKYNDLKEEILNNNLGNLTVSEWDFIAYKASIYLESYYVKKEIRSNSGVAYNKSKEYRFCSHPDLKQMICLMILCDFKNIAISLRNSYLKHNKKEKENDLKERHKEYYHFARLIRINVEMFGVAESYRYSFGQNVDESSVFHIVYNVPNDINFKWLRVKWNYPISTVSNLNLLKNENDGFLLEFDRKDGAYLDCRFISRFYCEKEALFMDIEKGVRYSFYADDKKQEVVTKPLPICNIGKVNSYVQDEDAKNYMLYIHAFIEIINTQRKKTSFGLSSLFKKQWIGRPSQWNRDKVEKYENDLIYLIQNKFTYYRNSKNISYFAKNCINSFFREQKEFGISLNFFGSEHKFLSHLFLSKDLKGLNFQFISYLFPNCDRVTIYDMQYRLGEINQSFFDGLFGELENINKSSTANNKSRKKENSLLIYGYIRCACQNQINNFYIPNGVTHLILKFYPSTILSKITEIVFIDCINEKAEKLIESLKEVVPKGWSLNVKRTTIRIVIGGDKNDKGPSSLYVRKSTRSSGYWWR